MKSGTIAVAAIVCSLALVSPITGADQPKFEAASVKRRDRCGGASSINPGSVALRGVPLRALLMIAFKVRTDQIEGPSWLETDCFDISAKIPEGATRDEVPAMLKALLTDRFKLVARTEDRMRSGQALVVDKGGPKLKESDPNSNFMGREKGMKVYSAARAPFGALKGVMTMATLAANLSTKGYGPVQDGTGLTGKYDIDLRWMRSDAEPAPSGATVPTPAGWPDVDLLTALRQSLGLRLERRNVPAQFLVIDHIERVPTEN